MEKPESLSIFLPAFNEEANIRDATIAARDAAACLAAVYEIIVVDDGSTDGTAQVVRRLAEEDSHIRLVSHERNRGYGAAVKTGIGASRYDWVFFTDADRQFDVGQLSEFFEHVPAYQVVVGYRAERRDPWWRLITSRGWNLLTRFAFGLKARDINCAFKLFKGDLVRGLGLESEGAMINAEILMRLSSAGVAIKEAPVRHYARERGVAGGANLKVQLLALRELLRLRKSGLRPREKTERESRHG